jgi:hypothetical protein
MTPRLLRLGILEDQASGKLTVSVSKARGWKCDRCWKILPEVGLCSEHPKLCMRCVRVVTDEEPQLFQWTAMRFDSFYTEALQSGMTKEEAIAHASDLNLHGAMN